MCPLAACFPVVLAQRLGAGTAAWSRPSFGEQLLAVLLPGLGEPWPLTVPKAGSTQGCVSHGQRDGVAAGFGPGEVMAQQAVCPSWSSASKTDPVCGESAVLEPEGVRGAPRAPQVPASPSHGEDAAAVYWGAAAGGNLAAAALAGLLTEQPCKRRGGASGSASPVCRTWEPLSIFFQLHLHQRLRWFAWGNPIPVTAGPPRCHPRGAKPILGHGGCHGTFWPGVTWVRSCP